MNTSAFLTGGLSHSPTVGYLGFTEFKEHCEEHPLCIKLFLSLELNFSPGGDTHQVKQ